MWIEFNYINRNILQNIKKEKKKKCHGSTHFDAGRSMPGCGPKQYGPVWPAHGARVGALTGWIRVRSSKAPTRIRLTAKSETRIPIRRLLKFISKLESESNYQIRNPNPSPYPNSMDFQNSYQNSNRNPATKSKTWFRFRFRIRIWIRRILKIHVKLKTDQKCETEKIRTRHSYFFLPYFKRNIYYIKF